MQLANIVTGRNDNRELFNSAHRLTLASGEARRLPGTFREIAVQSGCLWLSVAGKDVVLEAGESLRLNPGRDFAVVEAMSRQAATFTLSRQ